MSCQACTAFQIVVKQLMDTIERQQKLLMAFNRAGLHLAQHEETMAKLAIHGKEVEADAMKAAAELSRAETRKIAAEEGELTPRFGASGHNRTYVGTTAQS